MKTGVRRIGLLVLVICLAACSGGGGKQSTPIVAVKRPTNGQSAVAPTPHVHPIGDQACAGVGIGVQFTAASPEQELRLFVTPSGGNPKDWVLTARTVDSATFAAKKPNHLNSGDGLASITITRHGDAWGGLFEACVGPPFPPFSAARVVGTVREVGGPPPGLNRQISGSIVATDAAGTRWLATTTATQPFTLTLPPGTYRFTGRSPMINDGQSRCSAAAPVVVVGYKTTKIEVVCNIE